MFPRNANPYEFDRTVDVSAATRNRVLRNTYWMLALTMIPTVAGAWLGIALQFRMPFGAGINTLIYLGIAFGLMFAVEKYKHSGVGVALLLGFTFFMGLMLSRILQIYLAIKHGPEIVSLAAGGTALAFFGLAAYASASKRDFSSWGKFLMIGLVMLIVASIANVFLQLPALQLTIAVIGCGLFSALLLFDLSRVVNGGETNYVSATLAIYLDLYNLFISLLQILGFARSE